MLVPSEIVADVASFADKGSERHVDDPSLDVGAGSDCEPSVGKASDEEIGKTSMAFALWAA